MNTNKLFVYKVIIGENSNFTSPDIRSYSSETNQEIYLSLNFYL